MTTSTFPPIVAHFGLGKVFASPAALNALETAKVSHWDLIRRHARGDWGEVNESDRRENYDAMAYGLRILSSYALPTGERVWVITEADRSATTLLLPEDY